MSALIQISDPHFGTEQPGVVSALLALASRVRPVAAVLSGDITQRARRAQFAAARRFVDQLEVAHWLAIPGNHDVPLFNLAARIFFPYAGFKRAFGDALEPLLEIDGFQIVGVNTTRPSRHKDGEISKEQVERVARQLSGAGSERLKIVVTHQPVHVLRAGEVHNRVHGFEDAVTSWAAAGADIIMGGHIHLPYVAALREHFPELSRQCWVVQAGTAVSWRVRANHPNSVNLLHYTQGSAECCVERWEYESAGGTFERAQALQLQLDRTLAA